MEAMESSFWVHFEAISSLAWGLFIFNLLVFFFSGTIVRADPRTADPSIYKTRLWILRALNFVLFVLNVVLVPLKDSSVFKHLAESGIILMLAYLTVHFLHVFALRRFGRTKDIDGEAVLSETYASGLFGLLATISAAVSAFVVLLNIWDATDWLKATSAFGALLVIVYTTKDVWLSDAINGLILLYQKDTEPGTIVRIEEHGLLAVMTQITLTHTVFRDLRQQHRILLPNTKVRDAKLEIFNAEPNKSFRQYIDFNIGYGVSSDAVEAFFTMVWETACDVEKSLDADAKPRVLCLNNGDHAVTWRVYFGICSIYRMVPATCAFHRAAYDLSMEHGIGLDTPLTHVTPVNYTEQSPIFPESLRVVGDSEEEVAE